MSIKLNRLCTFEKGNAIFSLALVGLLYSLLQFNSAYADPPPWAQAHGYRDQQNQERDDERDNDRGYRKEHHHEHDGESDDENRSPRGEVVNTTYVAPYGIDQGTCDRERLGQVLGGIAGAAIGSTVKQGDGSNNSAAIIGGAIIGIIVGGNIGRSMDRVDQGCVGQILEHDPDGNQVAWLGGEGNTQYQVTPQKPFKDNNGRYCRKYLTNAVAEGVNRKTYNTACRESDGTWKKIR